MYKTKQSPTAPPTSTVQPHHKTLECRRGEQTQKHARVIIDGEYRRLNPPASRNDRHEWRAPTLGNLCYEDNKIGGHHPDLQVGFAETNTGQSRSASFLSCTRPGTLKLTFFGPKKHQDGGIDPFRKKYSDLKRIDLIVFLPATSGNSHSGWVKKPMTVTQICIF